jgi:hypothetical protein
VSERAFPAAIRFRRDNGEGTLRMASLADSNIGILSLISDQRCLRRDPRQEHIRAGKIMNLTGREMKADRIA